MYSPCPTGSNVAALQTEAILDAMTDEWVVHTPDEGAIKWWIGSAAEDGRAATVFARYASMHMGSVCLARFHGSASLEEHAFAGI